MGIGLAALAIVIAVGNLPMLKTEEEHQGVTTEVAMLVMFLVFGTDCAGHRLASHPGGGDVQPGVQDCDRGGAG